MNHRPDAQKLPIAPVAWSRLWSTLRPEVRAELRAEAVRHRYLLQIQGDRLFPESIPVDQMQRALDLGCGGGEWVFALAERYPRLSICGGDINRELLQAARARRNSSGLRRLTFRQLDFKQPLPFAERSFDYVHMRCCGRFIHRASWPQLLKECLRVLRPQGWLTIVELELCESSSGAFMELVRAFNATWLRLGYALDESALSFGIAARLYGMLLQAGLRDVTYEVYSADLGRQGGEASALFLAECLAAIRLAAPLIIQQNILSPPALQELLARAAEELQAPDCCGWGLLISASGRLEEGAGAAAEAEGEPADGS
jgi:ubiquinone/menaquinone biosynthesis C-methylase UbiE